jgi:hypothetical protein
MRYHHYVDDDEKGRIPRSSDRIGNSTNELRLNFDRVLKTLKQGRSLTLTYRNKPLAGIVPLKEERLHFARLIPMRKCG